jgi:hypothetical protein
MYPFLIFITLAATMLIATVQDFKAKKVNPLTWMPALIICAVLNLQGILELPANWQLGALLMGAIGILMTMALSWLLYIKKLVAGADVKGIITIGLCNPFQPGILIVTLLIAFLISLPLGKKYAMIPWICYLTSGYLITMALVWLQWIW